MGKEERGKEEEEEVSWKGKRRGELERKEEEEVGRE